MPEFICTTCGTQYPKGDAPPAHCTICQEARQYVNPLRAVMDDAASDAANACQRLPAA